MNNWIGCAGFIPFWLRDDPTNPNKYLGATPAMKWIMCEKTEPPDWMRYDSSLEDDFGDTLATYWIEFVKTEPPEWMRYDEIGYTLAAYWIKFVETEPPKWMRRK